MKVTIFHMLSDFLENDLCQMPQKIWNQPNQSEREEPYMEAAEVRES